MSLGTAFTSGPSPRSVLIETLVKTLGLDVEIQNDKTDERYTSNFPLKKLPVFLTKDNVAISETVAVANYLISVSQKSDYSGKNNLDRASVLQWLSFANSDFLAPLIQIYSAGDDDQKKKAAVEKAAQLLQYVNDKVSQKSYLVSDYETVADLFMKIVLGAVFTTLSSVFDAKDYPNIANYVNSGKNN